MEVWDEGVRSVGGRFTGINELRLGGFPFLVRVFLDGCRLVLGIDMSTSGGYIALGLFHIVCIELDVI